MTSVDRPGFVRLLTTFASIHNRKLDEAVLTAYYEALEDVPFDVLEQAAIEVKKHARHMPKPADFREAVQKVRRATPVAPPIVDEQGVPVLTFICLRCEDTGWRPACGCDTGRLDISHRCPEHGGEGHEGKAPIRVRACECRPTNAHFNRDRGVRYVESDRGAA
jgi:hypothetical protein